MKKIKIQWNKGNSFLAAILLGLIIFLGMMIGTSLRYSDIHSLSRQAVLMASEISGNTHQLTHYINQPRIQLTPELISQFALEKMEKPISEIQKEIKRIPPNKIRATERMNQGMLFIRKARVNYDLALKELQNKNYDAAKGQLQYARYYAEKAETVIAEKNPVSFQFGRQPLR